MFDDVEVLDFAGHFEVFGTRPVLSRNKLSVNPDCSFGDCPTPNILVVPGGWGTRREKHNPAVLDFIRRNAGQAERVLSVCSGALLLAKAGVPALLKD